jgi:hypothetical protein
MFERLRNKVGGGGGGSQENTRSAEVHPISEGNYWIDLPFPAQTIEATHPDSVWIRTRLGWEVIRVSLSNGNESARITLPNPIIGANRSAMDQKANNVKPTDMTNAAGLLRLIEYPNSQDPTM